MTSGNMAHMPSILIAEDVESNYLYLKAALRKEPLNLVWVKNGQEAVEEIKKNSEIDIVLMDLQMPIMNGFDATKVIKEIRPDLPIIVQTAFVMSEDIDRARDAGCNDYIAKPIRATELIDKINNYL